MGFYKDGRYVHEPTDVGGGLCDEETYENQEREKQKKLDKNNAGEISSPINEGDE